MSMMDKEVHKRLVNEVNNAGGTSKFAKKIGSTPQRISAIMLGYNAPTPQLATAIQVVTSGRIRREELRPDVYGSILEVANLPGPTLAELELLK